MQSKPIQRQRAPYPHWREFLPFVRWFVAAAALLALLTFLIIWIGSSEFAGRAR